MKGNVKFQSIIDEKREKENFDRYFYRWRMVGIFYT